MGLLDLKVLREQPEEVRALLRRTLRETGGNLTKAAARCGSNKGRVLEALAELGMRDEPRRQREAAHRRFRLLPSETKPHHGIRLQEMAYQQHPMQARIQLDPKGAAEEIADLYRAEKCHQRNVAARLSISVGTLIRYIHKLDIALRTPTNKEPFTGRLARIKASALKEGWHHHELGGRPIGS